MKLRFLAPAAEELEAAADFYDAQESGLGVRFLNEIESAIRRIQAHPESSRLISRRTRRALLPKFPYGLIYQVRDDAVLIVAVTHLRRRPGSWRDRLPRTER